MDTIKFNKKNLKVIAHRGLSGIETENTNSAFVAAGNRSYWGIETDVHKTADGKFAVIHDNNTGRVANEDIPVEDSPYDKLSALILKNSDNTFDRGDLKIPSLAEYIKICKKYDKYSILELKSAFLKDEITEIINIISETGHLEKTIFISFVLNNLIILREILPNQKAQYLTDKFDADILNTLLTHKLDLDIYYKNLSEENVKELKNHGIEINVWTCDDSESAEKLSELGIEYLTSNILE